MELTHITTFLKIVHVKNFSKAAEQLGYSQSAVTIQIKKLEQELGVPLFDRIGKRIKLTEHGEAFVSHAQEILKVVHEAKNFSNLAEPKGKLYVGCAESICNTLMPKILAEFYRQYPAVEIVIRTNKTEEMLEQLKSNELDLVYTLDHKVYGTEFVKVIERQEETIFVAASGHPLTRKKIVPLEQLVTQPFILTEQGVSYRYELERVLADYHLEINPMLEIGNTEIIINLLKQKLGVSFLPQFAIKELLEKGSLKEITTEMPKITIWHQLIHHKNKWITPQMKAFIALIEKHQHNKF